MISFPAVSWHWLGGVGEGVRSAPGPHALSSVVQLYRGAESLLSEAEASPGIDVVVLQARFMDLLFSTRLF